VAIELSDPHAANILSEGKEFAIQEAFLIWGSLCTLPTHYLDADCYPQLLLCVLLTDYPDADSLSH